MEPHKSFLCYDVKTMKRAASVRINCILLILILILGFAYQAKASTGSYFAMSDSCGDLSGSTGEILDFVRISSGSVLARPSESTGEIIDSVYKTVLNNAECDWPEFPLPLLILFALIWAILFVIEYHIVIPSITTSLRMIMCFIQSQDGCKSILS